MENKVVREGINIGWEIKKVLKAREIPLKNFAEMAMMKRTTLQTVLESSEIDIVKLKLFSELLGVNFFEFYVNSKDENIMPEKWEKEIVELKERVKILEEIADRNKIIISQQEERIRELQDDKRVLKEVIGKLGSGNQRV